MSFLLQLSILLLTFNSTASFAQVIIPERYADLYCQLRRFGVDEDKSLKLATLMAIEEGTKPSEMEYYGKKYRTDVFSSQVEALRICPDL